MELYIDRGVYVMCKVSKENWSVPVKQLQSGVQVQKIVTFIFVFIAWERGFKDKTDLCC